MQLKHEMADRPHTAATETRGRPWPATEPCPLVGVRWEVSPEPLSGETGLSFSRTLVLEETGPKLATVETDGREVHGETQRSAAQRRDGGWRPRRSDFLMFKRILGCVLFGLFLVKDVRR